MLAELRKCHNMEPIYWQRREGASFRAPGAPPAPTLCPAADLESRRVDPRKKTYAGSRVDLSYPAPGCGAGAWDGLPPGHRAQQVDLEVASPVLLKLGLPATWDGARCATRRTTALALTQK